LEIGLSLLEAKERIKDNASLDNEYQEVCQRISMEGIVNKQYTIKNDIQCWKFRVYVPEGLRQTVMKSEHNSKLAGHFGREQTLELICQNCD